jgi:organic radical activating enzyme
MNLPHPKFCVLPWVSLEASPIGTVRPCCLADDEIVDSHSVKFNLKSANFRDIQNSEYMYQLRQAFLAGQQPATCRKCWNEEDAGRTSKRMHTLDRLKHMGISDTWTQDAKPLMFLDLKLGNICNLKCRICGSWSSSSFAVEEIANSVEAHSKTSFAYQMLKAGRWPRENEQFWTEIDSVLDDIRYIEFTGGEPFMIEEHFEMLQGIVNRGIAHQVEIHYNTNGTQWPANAEHIWKHFKTVEIAFSIDDLCERFEYQRTGASWVDVQTNIKLFRELKKRHANIQLQCCSTVNIFNVRYIDQLANWVSVQGFDFVYWNIMHDAWYFSVAALPNTAKQAIADHLNTALIPSKYKKDFAGIVEFMMQGQSTDGAETCRHIQKLDQWREQNLATVAPELAELLGYEN